MTYSSNRTNQVQFCEHAINVSKQFWFRRFLLQAVEAFCKYFCNGVTAFTVQSASRITSLGAAYLNRIHPPSSKFLRCAGCRLVNSIDLWCSFEAEKTGRLCVGTARAQFLKAPSLHLWFLSRFFFSRTQLFCSFFLAAEHGEFLERLCYLCCGAVTLASWYLNCSTHNYFTLAYFQTCR